MAPARSEGFLPEVWGLYSLGTLWIVLRFAVRLRMDGVRGLKLDDALALIALSAWTYTSDEVAQFDQAKFDEVTYGSKLFLGSWYAYLVLNFTLRGIVLILYQRIFFEHWQKLVMRIMTALCVCGFVGLTFALSFTCLPFHQRWQVSPTPPIACTASPKILIATSCVNAVTDVFLLSVPVSLLVNLQKPLKTRITVFVLLASGMFVLATSCIIRVSLTVVTDIFILSIARWSLREFCVAIIAVNTASLRPMFRQSFWKCTFHIQPKRNNFAFAPSQQARQQVGSQRRGNQKFDSTSAGAHTMDVYIQRELGDEIFALERPAYQMMTNVPPHAAPEASPKNIDLEKGKPFRTQVVRMDSASPLIIRDDDAESRAGSRHTRSSGS